MGHEFAEEYILGVSVVSDHALSDDQGEEYH